MVGLDGVAAPQTSAKNETGVEAVLEHPSNHSSYKPGSTTSYSHDWSRQGTGGHLRTHGRHFIDAYGRVCNLRGVNLSGSCKTPVNHDHETFPHNDEPVTFVGRPFPLEEAQEHFSRLRRWGLTFVRFLVTWEAIEHAGEGIYDTEYLDYIRKLLSLLPQYGLTAFVSMHQDVWSRYSGGSGAPAWTLEAVGFDLHALEDSAAAWLVGIKGGGHVESERGLWPTGYHKLAAATMATCFWAGDTFAPDLKVRNRHGQLVPVQQYLQGAYLDASEQLARAVGDLDGVIGFQAMNEPHRGYIDLQSLHSFDYNTDLHLSHIPSAFQSFQLGAGHPTMVDIWTRSFPMPTRKTGSILLNAGGRKAWREDGPTNGQCVWQTHGVWGWCESKNAAVVLRENYFNRNPATGEKVWHGNLPFDHLTRDIDRLVHRFLLPFLHKWAERVRGVSPPHKVSFVEPIPNEFCPTSWTAERQLPNMVFSPHWYDLNALFGKAFGEFSVNVQGLSRGMFPLKAFYWGQKGTRDNYTLQIRNIVEAGYKALGEKPVIIGECGVPMDMNNREAFDTEDFSWQSRMMDAMMTALEQSLVGFTLWNYNTTNDDQTGDDWNGENFSWFSRKRALPPFLLYYEQDAPSLDGGGRILPSIVRPYPAKTAGIPLRFEYEMNTGSFVFEWANPEPGKATAHPPLSGHPPLTARETEIFVPSLITHGRKVMVDGLGPLDQYHYDKSRQTLFIVAHDTAPGATHKIGVFLNPPLDPAFGLNDFWGDFGPRVISFFVLVIGVLVWWLFLL
ncbi:glycoside hydrolase family 5 protein [Infundibulicybe gibba]|nr:glycoside hydrolase family 5 protein [Infundibulicybe gibba]